MATPIPSSLSMREARKLIAAMFLAFGLLGSSLPANAQDSAAKPEVRQTSPSAEGKTSGQTNDQMAPSSATNAATDLLNAWVNSFKTDPAASVEIGDIVAGDRNRSATLQDVAISYDFASDALFGAGGLSAKVLIKEMTLEGLRVTDGLLQVDALEITDAADINIGLTRLLGTEENATTNSNFESSFDLQYQDVLIEGLTIPLSFQKINTSNGPAGFILDALNTVRQVKVARAFTDQVTETRRFNGGYTSATTYKNSIIMGIEDGRIAHYSVDDIKATEIHAGTGLAQQSIKTTTTIDTLILRGLDMAPIIGLMGGPSTPDRSILLAREELSNIRFSVGDLSGSVDVVLVEDIGVLNQQPLALIGLLDQEAIGQSVDEDALARAAIAALATVHVGRFEIGGVEFESGDQTASLNRFEARDFGGTGLGALSVDDLAIQTDADNYITLGHFGLSRVMYPPLEAIFALEGVDDPTLNQILAALPTIGKLVISAVELKSDLLLPGSSGSSRSSGDTGDGNAAVEDDTVYLALLEVLQSGFISSIPTNSAVILDGLELPTSLLGDPQLVQLLQTLGMTNIELNQALSIAWDPDTKDLDLKNLSLQIPGGGIASLSLKLGNVPKNLFENPDMAQFSMASATFKSGRLRIASAELIEAFISNEAAKNQLPKHVLTGAFADTLKDQLGTLAETRFGRDLVNALEAFLMNPDELVVELTPENPVAMTELLGLYVTSPNAIPARLRAKVSPTGE